MPSNGRVTLDGNEAAASVAFRVSETIAIYPITPSSPRGNIGFDRIPDPAAYERARFREMTR